MTPASTEEARVIYTTVLGPLWPDLPPWAAVQTLGLIGMDPWPAAAFGGVPGYGPLIVTVTTRDGHRYHRASTASRAQLAMRCRALETYWDADTTWQRRWDARS